MAGEMYSDGRVRSANWRRPDYQVWAAIERMFAEHLEEELLKERWDNEALKDEISKHGTRNKVRLAHA